MSPGLALAIAGALVVLAIVAGLVVRARDGRRSAASGLRFDPSDGGAPLAERATLVQFSTEFCTRCPQVRRLLTSYADQDDSVAHVEVDLTHRPDLSSRYRVLQTPTTFVVDRSGAVRARFYGVPRPAALTEALAAL